MTLKKIKIALTSFVLLVTFCMEAFAQAVPGTTWSGRSVTSAIRGISIDLTQGTEGVVIAHLYKKAPDISCGSMAAKIDIASVGLDAAKLMMDTLLAAKLSEDEVTIWTAFCVANAPSIIRVDYFQ